MKQKSVIKIQCLLLLGISSMMLLQSSYGQAKYLTGDFHQHTTYSDGSWSISHMMSKNNQYGLDWWANSEHGGGFTKNAAVSGTDKGTTIYWDSYVPNPIIGKVQSSGGHQVMWRWQSLRDSSFAQILAARVLYPSKTILQSYEMNVPGHEHGCMGLITNQFSAIPNCNPLAEFEYKFDNNDGDDVGGVAQGWVKSTLTGHAKSLEAITCLQTNYPTTSYLVPAHPERQKTYKINFLRDMNDAGPSVFFGFESMPGHQKDANRGGYGASADGGGAFGGCGMYAAEVGGLWDAMLSEGRKFWLFASSDFHDPSGDFYPGEYQKTYTYSTANNAQSIVDGLRSGNSWVVEGDLIDSLVYNIETIDASASKSTAVMGSNISVNYGQSIKITIKVRDPQGINTNNTFSSYTNPILNHIDLIKGKVGAKIQSTDLRYSLDTIATTSVIARFDAVGGITDSKNIVSKKWTNLGNGWAEMSLIISNVTDSMYFRLRGSNLGLNVANETDADGNPLSDVLMGANNAEKAFADLWFYSNPIFVSTQSVKQETLKSKITLQSDDLEEYLPTTGGQTIDKTVGDIDSGSSDLELGCVDFGTNDPQLVGLRFPNIKIPRNSVITSATIEFEVDASDKNSSPCNLYIYAENNDNPATFAYTPFALTLRPKIADSVAWVINNGDGEVVNEKLSTSNIRNLVQKLVDRNGWVSGNAMAFYIKGTGTREMESVNGEPAAAPSLSIKYYTPKTSRTNISTASDDVEEWLSPEAGQTQSKVVGVVDSTSSDLELGCESGLNADPQIVGLRFSNLGIAKNTPIASAYIEFEADAINKNANPANYTIYVEDADSAATFTYQPFAVSSRPKMSEKIEWSVDPTLLNVIDQKGKSVDISWLVQSIINRNGWKSGNALAFYIKGSGVREVESFEGEKVAAASLIINYFGTYNRIDSVLESASILVDTNYTTPSWTAFKRNYTVAAAKRDSLSVIALENAIKGLQPNNMPYNVVMSFNGDPISRMGFAWFTNVGIKNGKVELVEGSVSNASAFTTPAFTFNATSDSVKNTNYCVSANDLLYLAGIANNTKKSYMSNKALATGLKPNTTYSFRVGKTGAWSEIGKFTTAKNTKESFSFVYFTDPQANTDAMFSISQKTTHSAKAMYPNANFWLSCGDLIETSGSTNSEWEYEQFFQTQQDIWYNYPFVPVTGNHDKSANKNFTNHFNTSNPAFDKTMSTTPGSIYSFVYGDALFMALSYEDYSAANLDSLAKWMRKQVEANPNVKWRIAYYHKTMYTGSGSHQSDADGMAVRNRMAPLFDSLKIDLAMQGHDHIYEVMGPIYNKAKAQNAITNQKLVTPIVRENLTGKQGGTFDVKNGTLYFLNNSAGRKKYEPRDSATMKANEAALGITDYYTLFTGKFGQTGEPTFSSITVSSDSINIKTYTVDDNGLATIFDDFKVIKSNLISWSNPADIIYNTPLSNTQLNATAPTGTIAYSPISGTVLNAGNNQSLKATLASNNINYSNVLKEVFINVEKATPVVTWNTPADIIYNTLLSNTQLNATANVGGSFNYTPAINTKLNSGSQLLQTNFNPTDANYKSILQSVNINVSKANPEITWSNPADITSDVALSETQLNATANITGNFAYTPSSGTKLLVGQDQELKANFTPVDTNYNSVTKTVTINITKSTGVSELNNSKVTICPNPVSDYISIKCDEAFSKVTIIDSRGMQVINKVGNMNDCNISVQNLPLGVYFVSITLNNQVITTKIIKE